MSRKRNVDADRRQLFRRMELVYLYLPPILAIIFASIGGWIIASFMPISGGTFRGRWALGSLALLIIPTAVYFVREAVRKR